MAVPYSVAPKDFPAGNVQVGDEAWRKAKASDPDWDRDWKVVAVGLIGEKGWASDIQIQKGAAVLQVPSYRTYPDTLYVFPRSLTAAPVVELVQGRYLGRLAAIRKSGNSDGERLELLCLTCEVPLHEHVETYETADLTYGDGEFYAGKLDMNECITTVRCNCPDKTWALTFTRDDGEEFESEDSDDEPDEDADEA